MKAKTKSGSFLTKSCGQAPTKTTSTFVMKSEFHNLSLDSDLTIEPIYEYIILVFRSSSYILYIHVISKNSTLTLTFKPRKPL